MDSTINAAARALALADPLTALKYVALRADPPALALRGIAMAQLGELARARTLLRRAAHKFGAGEPVARARCVVAQAEVALALRDLVGAQRGLDEAATLLASRGDVANVAVARLVQVRRRTLLGEVEGARQILAALVLPGAPPLLSALLELAAADLAMRRVDEAGAEQSLRRAREAASRAGASSLLAEVERAEQQLRVPVARALVDGQARALKLGELRAVWASGTLAIDACRREARRGDVVVSLVTRPVLLALLVALAEAAPGDVARDVLIRRVFGARRIDESHRVRLRVELGRLRKLITGLAGVRATTAGFELVAGASGCCVLLPPTDGDASAVLALLRGGEAWATSGLATALGTSQRAVQRALLALAQEGKVRAVGAGRSRRWVGAPCDGSATTLLLVAPGSLG